MRRRDTTGRLAKYQVALGAYDLKFEHVPGPKNTLADHMSRYPPNTFDPSVHAAQVADEGV
jgi:hypothetical protein